MRSAAGVAFLSIVIGTLPTPADSLPASCGPVGATSYSPPTVAIPPVVLNNGTVITVTNATVIVNGDISSVTNLIANPGPDGISLQEALAATNNELGVWNIRFASALKGSTIVVDTPPSQGLPFLAGGNVTINGDVDGDGQPDITLTSNSGNMTIFVISGGNTINGLALQNCGNAGCVILRNPSASGGLGQGPTVTGKTFSNTTLSNLLITNMPMQGSAIQICPNCGPASSPTGNTWDHVLITGNTITGAASGPVIGIEVQVAWGDTLQHTTIANNNIVIPAQGASGISFITGSGLGPADQGSDIVLDARVINNTVTASEGIAFRSTAVGSLYDGAQLIGNHIISSGPGGTAAGGITFLAADVESGLGPTQVQRWHGNVMKNLAILGNTIEGTSVAVSVLAGQNAATNNAISNVAISGNTILNTQTMPASPTTGIFLYAGRSDGSAFVAAANSLSNVLIQANTVQSLIPPGNINFGGGVFEYAYQSAGISVSGGIGAQGNSVNGISIANNDVNTPQVGIAVTGGNGAGAPAFSSDDNFVSAAQIYCNQIDQAPTNGVTSSSGIKGIDVAGGLDEANGNQVQQVLVTNNLVVGVLGGASVVVPYLGTGGSGNTIEVSQASAPWPQFLSAGLVSDATFQSSALVPGSLVSLFGINLNGAAVQFGGVSAPILYSSASQTNLQVPWEVQGESSASVTVSSNGFTTAPQAIAVNLAAPAIFALGSPNGGPGAILNSAGTVVNVNTPAHVGDLLEIYCTGLGAVSNTPQTGALAGGATLSNLIAQLTATIGSVAAPVSFAGLAPGYIGLYQVNVQVPPDVAAGDSVPVVITTAGLSSNSVVISVR